MAVFKKNRFLHYLVGVEKRHANHSVRLVKGAADDILDDLKNVTLMFDLRSRSSFYLVRLGSVIYQSMRLDETNTSKSMLCLYLNLI